MASEIETLMFRKKFGENVRVKREAVCMTQDELAEIIGMTPGLLKLIEKGRRSFPMKNFQALSEALNISMDSMFPDTNNSLRGNDTDWPRIEEAVDYMQKMDSTDVSLVVYICKHMVENRRMTFFLPN